MLDESEERDGSYAPSKRLRLFVAVNFPSEIQKNLNAIRGEAPEVAREVRWTKPEQVHLTLKFLGSMDPASVGEIERALTAAVRDVSVMTLRAEGIGCFPDAHRPRILWAGIAGDVDVLLNLQSRVDEALCPWAEPEKRSYAAHITLGRFKGVGPATRRSLKGLLERDVARDFGEWQVQQIDLMQSLLTGAGSSYKCLASMQLMGGSREGGTSGTQKAS
jgi:2'-5' RNA ligase